MEVDQEFADIFERSQMVSNKVMKAEYFFRTKRKIPSFIKESIFEKEAGCSNGDWRKEQKAFGIYTNFARSNWRAEGCSI